MPLLADSKEDLLNRIIGLTSVNIRTDLYRARSPVELGNLGTVLRLLNAPTIDELENHNDDRRNNRITQRVRSVRLVSKTLPRGTDVQEINKAFRMHLTEHLFLQGLPGTWNNRDTTLNALNWRSYETDDAFILNNIIPSMSRAELLEQKENVNSRLTSIMVLNDYNCGAASNTYFSTLVENGMLEAMPEYVLPMTQHPNHRVKLFKVIGIPEILGVHDMFVCTTNTYNTQVLLQTLAAALPTICAAVPEEIKPLVELAKDNMLRQNPDIADNLKNWCYVYYADYIANIDEAKRAAAINTLITQMSSGALASVERRIANVNDTINNYYAALRDSYRMLEVAQMEHLRLITGSGTEKIEELKNFLIASSNTYTNYDVRNDGAGNIKLSLLVNTPLLYWDEAQYKMLRESTRENRVTALGSAHKQYFDDILLNKSIILNMESGVSLNLSVANPSVMYADIADRQILLDDRKGMSNPHHRYHHCFGNNKTPIYNAIKEQDYITLLCQAAAAVAGINISDGTVMSKFFDTDRDLSELRDAKILTVAATKERISPREYFQRIKTVGNKSITEWLAVQNATPTTPTETAPIELPIEDQGEFAVPTAVPTAVTHQDIADAVTQAMEFEDEFEDTENNGDPF